MIESEERRYQAVLKFLHKVNDGDVYRRKRRIKFGREKSEHTEFEMLARQPSEQKSTSEHSLATYYALGPVLRTFEEQSWAVFKDDQFISMKV